MSRSKGPGGECNDGIFSGARMLADPPSDSKGEIGSGTCSGKLLTRGPLYRQPGQKMHGGKGRKLTSCAESAAHPSFLDVNVALAPNSALPTPTVHQ